MKKRMLRDIEVSENDCQNKQDNVSKSVNDWIADLGF